MKMAATRACQSAIYEARVSASRFPTTMSDDAASRLGGAVTSESCGLQLEHAKVPSMNDFQLLIQACFVAQRLGAASRASSQVRLWHYFVSLFLVLM